MKPPINYPQMEKNIYLIMVQIYPHITMSQQIGKILKLDRKKKWSEVLDEHKSSEEKLKVILEIVIKIIEENCTTFRKQ